MISDTTETQNTLKLYPYQEADINCIFERMGDLSGNHRLLYQLPTGGGKTTIFSEIARRFIQQFNRKVIILTHRQELCNQTSTRLKTLGVKNKAIVSTVKQLSKRENYPCYVAMVETLKNRIKEGIINTSEVGLVIIDEAHHNSFHKLLGKFTNANILGVTATPFSSNIELPMRKNYDELIVGESIESLIDQGYLAKPVSWRYDVELNSLKTGIHGDFTVSTSDELYSSPAMLELLLHAYEEHSKNKKTLIFNNGIFTSKAVCHYFEEAGYPIKHLDNYSSAIERADTLKWFKKTKSAILTSVSILTTGFDEPTIQTVILNRATTSITLYHQMIGRGSRRLPQKKTFNIIDLGNNTDRFGEWKTAVDWKSVFDSPEAYYESMHTQTSYEAHNIPADLRACFPNSLQVSFDVQKAYQDAIENGKKARVVMSESVKQHALMCMENSETTSEALALTEELDKEIDWRIKQYAKCLGKVTKNYTEWLKDDYRSKLKTLIQRAMRRRDVQKMAS